MRILIYVISKIKMFLFYAWMILSFIPLGLGVIMLDILLKVLGVEKTYLLSTEISNWADVLSAYLKNKAAEIRNNTNNTEGVNK